MKPLTGSDDNEKSADFQAFADMVDAARTAHEITPDGGIYQWIVPEGHQIERLDTESLSATPRRHRGTIGLHTLDAFKGYVQRYAGVEAGGAPRPHRETTAIFANVDTFRVTAVLNYHDREAPGWADWRANYTLKPTTAWQAWTGFAGSWQKQEDFAFFLQQHVQDVIDPDGANLLTMASDLKLYKNVEFEKTLDLQSGAVQLLYNEVVSGAGHRSGALELPPTVTVSLDPFEGSDAYPLVAWLRYRVSDGHAFFMLDFGDEPRRVFEELFASYVAGIEDALGIPVWLGVAPEPLSASR